MRRRKSQERGAAAVEFALVSLLLLAMIAGVIQFAIYFWGFQAASAAAREAARTGAVNPCDETAIITRGKTMASNSGPVSSAGTTVVVSAPSKVVGDELNVTVSFSVMNIGVIPGFDPAVSKKATTRIENVPGGAC